MESDNRFRFLFLLLLFLTLIHCFSLYFSFVSSETKVCKWINYKYLCQQEDAAWPTIDIVYTWVNGSDPVLAKQLAAAKQKINNEPDLKPSDELSPSRFADNEELRYSLRSIEKFAPWVRHIYLVTNGQVPFWLDIDHPDLTVVSHSQLFSNSSHLPTFSSPAIETHLHELPQVAEHFIYFNDDVMLGGPTFPDDFKSISDGTKVYLSWGVPKCADHCNFNSLGNGRCDRACNVSMCHFDHGDCENVDPPPTTLSTNQVNPSISKMCDSACPDAWIGDGHCDSVCDLKRCGYDGGDCGLTNLEEMHQILVDIEVKQYNVPHSLDSLVVNMTVPVSAGIEIVSGAFSNTDVVRTASLSMTDSFIDMTLHPNIQAGAEVTILMELALNQTTIEEYEFDIVFIEDELKVEQEVPIEKEKGKKLSFLDFLPDDIGKEAKQYIADGLAGNSLSEEELGVLETYESLAGHTNFPPGAFESLEGEDANLPGLPLKKKPQRRTLKDTFGDSLRYVDYLYSKEFGFESRKVPAHMPHMINKSIMKELQARFPERWEKTSSHQLRKAEDMQYAFSYFYYLINQNPVFTPQRLFTLSDVDENGLLDLNELRTVCLRAFGHPIDQAKFDLTVEFFQAKNDFYVDVHVFATHTELMSDLRDYYVPRYVNKYETLGTDDVGFLMVNQNDTKLEEKLDGIREHQHKFICLNDNIDHGTPKAKEAVQLLHNFYNSLVPTQSSFELSPDKYNRYQYIDDIIKDKRNLQRIQLSLIAVFLLTVIWIYLL